MLELHNSALHVIFTRFSQNTEAARAAQEAAARINRQLGIQQDPNMQPQKPGPPFGVGGMVTTEEHRVPDKMVGLSKSSFYQL